MRRVRHHRRVPKEERTVACMIDEIEHRLHRLAADFQAFVAVTAAARYVPMRHAFGETTGALAFPPLAGLVAHVALCSEHPRDGLRALKQRRHARTIFRAPRISRRIVPDDAMLVWIESGHDGGKAGAAQTGRHVPTSEGKA